MALALRARPNMKFKLVDKTYKQYTNIRPRSEKGFNTDTVAIRSKVGSRCVDPAIVKHGVNTHRVNKETLRVKLAKAKFVPFPRLVVSPVERLVALTTNHNHNA